ncbi:uncharacterized protein [Gossypium hirsutum]|uniref:FRIGIDA-like protein 5 n=1 Tax=Gossypium hirsutum TaxID=3635 RepID=A0ABM3AZM0_GOSHI|nr:uncharacterized protein LOC107953452 [Gossypium hirsutum]
MEKLTDLELIELNKANLRRTMDEIQERASSILLLNIQWKDMEKVLDSAQSSIEERLKEVISKEEEMEERAKKLEKEIQRRESSVKEQFETLKVKEEELGRQFRDLELGKKYCEERLREVELEQKELEEKQGEFVLKEKAFDKCCRDFELEKKDLERSRKDLQFSVEQCEQQCKEFKLMEKVVNDKLGEIGLNENDLENRLSDFVLREQQFGLKEKSFEKRCMEFELEEKALEERRRDLEVSVKQCERQCEEFKLMEKSVKDKLEEVGVKEKYLEKCLSEYELKEEQFELKDKSFVKRYMEFEREEKAFKERCRDLEVNVKLYEQKYKRLEVTEKWVQKQLEEIKRKEEEFELRERDLGQRCRVVEISENCLQNGIKDLKLKSEQCEERFRELKLMEELVTTRFEDLEEKEEKFRWKLDHFEQRSTDYTMKETYLEKGRQDLDAKQKHNEECLREINLREKRIEESSEELARKYKLQFEDLECKVKQYDQRFMELELKEKLVNDQFEQIEAKEEQLGLKERHFEQCSKDFELKEKFHYKEFELKEKCLEVLYRELKAKEKHYDECLRKVELRKKEIEELSTEHRRKYEQQSSDLEFIVKKCEQQFKDLHSKEKKLAEWSKELERKSLASAMHPQVKNEAAGSLSIKCSMDHSSSAHLRFCIHMDGKDLQMFLNGRWKEHGSIGTEVAMALQLSGDPAKLVLDAMEGFYPPHLSKGDREFEGDVARRSCILLLEQLMKLSPEIKPNVKKEAMKLAFDWITKMRVEPGHELEVLGFLRLLASFQLADAFDADELVNFLVFAAQHIHAPELFKVLGLGDKIKGFIRKLVEKKQHMEAIRFIYAFEQVNEFPPVPMLKDFINHSKIEAKRIFRNGNKTPEARRAICIEFGPENPLDTYDLLLISVNDHITSTFCFNQVPIAYPDLRDIAPVKVLEKALICSHVVLGLYWLCLCLLMTSTDFLMMTILHTAFALYIWSGPAKFFQSELTNSDKEMVVRSLESSNEEIFDSNLSAAGLHHGLLLHCSPCSTNEADIKRLADLRAVVKCIEDHKLEEEYRPYNLKNLKDLIISLEKENKSSSLTSPKANPVLRTARESDTPSQQHGGIKRPREFMETQIVGDAPLGATATKMDSKHLKGLKQDEKVPPCPLGEQMEEPNCRPLQQQDSEKKHNATTGAPAVPSLVLPAASSTAPATISAPKQQENELKCPGTALSQTHSNPNPYPVTEYYSWEALARHGDEVGS